MIFWFCNFRLGVSSSFALFTSFSSSYLFFTNLVSISALLFFLFWATFPFQKARAIVTLFFLVDADRAKVGDANAKLGYLGAYIVNALAIGVEDVRLTNNSASMAITLSISIIDNYPKEVEKMNVYTISRLSANWGGKVENRIAIGITTSVCKGWNY